MSEIIYTTSDQIATTHGVKGCIYGNAGSGKTLLCATAPRPLMIQAESGALSLKRSNLERIFGVNSPGITYSIPLVSIASLADFERVYKDVTTRSEIYHSFDTLYIDSLSEIVETILSNKLSGKSNNGNKVDGRAAYGEMAEEALEWVKKFRDIPGKHVFVTCKQGVGEHSNMFGPNMPGKILPYELPYIFDEVFQINIGEDPTTKEAFRWLRTQPDLKNYAKDRSGALDPRGESAYLYNIIAKISAA